MNDAKHWNKIAKNYDNEIFNVFQNDKKKKLKKFVQKYANKSNVAIDFGCGVGKALPLLTPIFKEILAVDVSSKCIDVAKETPYKNVTYKVVDLAGTNVSLPQVNFAFCCNVAMSSNVKRNQQIIRNVLASLKKDGVALFVLPSLESASLSTLSLIQWYEKEGVELKDIPEDELNHFSFDNPKHVNEGIVKIDNLPTKHYLAAELYTIFHSENFVLNKLDRLEYNWDTEFDSPPQWMQSPYPWDWVIEVKRIK